mmetsp:Transcript_34376/g.72417  ORF Transcript_34376/g.72417 Transcript_34376/m.72417 type:complete len:105 (+) Transcript_34376:91-405(+)
MATLIHQAAAASGTATPSSLIDNERHELLVTYEGPFHPSAVRSSSSSSNNNNRKTFCLDLPSSGYDPLRGSSYISNNDMPFGQGWLAFLFVMHCQHQQSTAARQ